MEGGVVLAMGIAVYNPKMDFMFHTVFDRADEATYKQKHRLKTINA